MATRFSSSNYSVRLVFFKTALLKESIIYKNQRVTKFLKF